MGITGVSSGPDCVLVGKSPSRRLATAQGSATALHPLGSVSMQLEMVMPCVFIEHLLCARHWGPFNQEEGRVERKEGRGGWEGTCV